MLDWCCLRSFAKVVSSVAFYFNFLTCVLAGVALADQFGQWYRICLAVAIVASIAAHCALNYAVNEDEFLSECFLCYFIFQVMFLHCTTALGVYVIWSNYPKMQLPEKVVLGTLAVSGQLCFLVYMTGYYRYRRDLNKLAYRKFDIMSLATYRMRYEHVP
ncbi:hypothetical protein QR680_007883 [Steinernema hermaphroditum]|uniref:Uncharacterized protein n=1 Tax=Steinernema hermaphroditum TaxID=289476 RepID=A0AA39M614_9BILA|nr:hypothetical protein QR680_007883 [Steinernema hermaphroditum]